MTYKEDAISYLMTYGWAILIIIVVVGALFMIGVFNLLVKESPSEGGRGIDLLISRKESIYTYSMYILCMEQRTSIQIERKTLEKMKLLRITKRETYDEIINRLML